MEFTRMERKTYDVLVIEDNTGHYALIEELLAYQHDKFRLLHARNFEESQNILFSGQIRFDIILLGINLPEKARMPLINELLYKCNNTPVIILTGNADIEFGARSLGIGVSDCILKHDLTSTMLYKSIVYSIEREKSARALKESERKYGELFHLSPLPMWVVNLDTLQFLDVNNATIKHYGYSREEFLSMTIKDIRMHREVAQMEQSIAEHKQKPENNLQLLVTHVKKNGELINVELQITQVLHMGVKSSIVIAKDVTERMNYTNAMEAQNEKLREISWIQSHLVRAPLTRIIGLIPLIESAMEVVCDDEIKKILKYLALSANELDDIIMDITEISEKVHDTKSKYAPVLKRVS